MISTKILVITVIGSLSAIAAQTPIDLGAAGGFAVLGNTAVTSTGLTIISGGNVGTSLAGAVTGFPPAIVTPPFGIDTGNAASAQGHADLNTAYNNAVGRPETQNLTGQNLGGQTLDPGTYFFASSSQLTGTLTLDDQGDPNAVFIFQIGSTLTTAANSAVVSINGGAGGGGDVFWQIGSSATLGVDTAFEGNILADQSITVDTGATDLSGRLLALNGAVTLDNNLIDAPASTTVTGVPDKSTTFILLGTVMAGLCLSRFWFSHTSVRSR